MTSENRVNLSIIPIDNTKKHLCCNMCLRPIYKHEYAAVINNKYKLAPDFYKKCLVNEFTNGYDYINNSNLPINKLPYRINMKSWAAIKNDTDFIKNMTNGINSLMTNEANNFTDIDEIAFNAELDILKQEFITNRNTAHAHADADAHSHAHGMLMPLSPNTHCLPCRA